MNLQWKHPSELLRARSDTEENRGGSHGGASVRGLHLFAKDAKGWGSPQSWSNPQRGSMSAMACFQKLTTPVWEFERAVYLLRPAAQSITTDIGVKADFSCVLIKNR